jgi:hydroxyacylglutathione hydrolase
MPATTTLRELDYEEAGNIAAAGGAFVDLRPITEYLDVHIPGSLGLLYEFGPGMASRARDCIPLDVPLMLLDLGGDADYSNAAAALRGKGFEVTGRLPDGINRWAEATGESPASTEILDGEPPGATLLSVRDPGAEPAGDALEIPIEHLWSRAAELRARSPIAVVAGYGVRAALAVGILERAGVAGVAFWRSLRPR